MYKRIIALCLTICLVLSAVPAFAGAATGQQVSVSSATVTAGNTATVTLKAESFVNVATLEVYVYYDTSVLTLSSTANGSLISGAQASVNTSEAGTVKLVAMAVNGINGTGNLLSLYFKTAADCEAGTYPVTVAIGNAFDTSFAPTTIGAVSGNITVKEQVATETFTIYGYPSTSALKKGDTLSYRVASASSSRQFVSGEFILEYDPDIFAFDSASLESKLTGEGAFYSINSAILGQVRITYANDSPVNNFYLLTVKLTVIADMDGKTTITAQASNMYREDLSMYLPDDYQSTLTLSKLPEVTDTPNAFLQTEKLVVGQQSQSLFTLEAGSGVAAGDFTLTYDPSILRCVGVEKPQALEDLGGMLVVNDNYSEGTVKFSYILQSGSITEVPVAAITWEALQSPAEHYQITSSGVGVMDKTQNAVDLEYVTNTGCIYTKTVTAPDCLNPGSATYTCSCGLSHAEDLDPLGHDYSQDPLVCGTCSFVRASLELTTVSLRPSAAGLYFSGTLTWDQTDADIVSCGITVSLENPTPVADGSDGSCLYTKSSISALVSDIFTTKNKDAENRLNARMPVYARAYVQLADGRYIYSDPVQASLQQMVITIEHRWDTLSDLQKDALATMYKTYETAISHWDIPNIKALAETKQ